MDVWESEERWLSFARERLMPALEKFGVHEPPPYTASPVHGYFNTEAAHAAVFRSPYKSVHLNMYKAVLE